MTLNLYKNKIIKTIVSIFLALSFFTMVQVVHAATFYDNRNGTVADLTSTLMWQRCTAPSTEIDCTTASTLYNWDGALTYCNSLVLGGYSDWRLPNVKTLHSIIDASKTTVPSINTYYFPDAQASDYWTSTSFAGTAIHAWYVNFAIGNGVVMTSGVDKATGQYVRCVRGG